MEDIGGHFKFETIKGDIFHETNLLLSSVRNYLRYIIKERGIKKIYIPYFFKIFKLSSSKKFKRLGDLCHDALAKCNEKWCKCI